MISLLEKNFDGWEKMEEPVPEVAPIDPEIDPRVVYIHRDLEQTTIRMGHYGYNRLSPDRFPIEILNFIYGYGSFTSRLMSQIRSDRGLAYSVWGMVGRGTDLGLFTAAAQTKPESTIEAIEAMKEITREMREEMVTPDEIQGAIDTMTNQFVFLYDSPWKITNQTVDLKYYGYPDDFLETYIEKLQAVTAEDVLAAARKYLRPDEMVIVVVGDREEFDGDLSRFGPLVEKELEDYEQPSEPLF
ncbi:MAG: insulinase family protein [Pirellulaceae bacterium]